MGCRLVRGSEPVAFIADVQPDQARFEPRFEPRFEAAAAFETAAAFEIHPPAL